MFTKKNFLSAGLIIIAVVGLILFLFPFPHPLNAAQLKDPLQLDRGLVELAGRIIKGIVSVLGAITLAILIYGGVILLTSSGKDDWIKKGWQTFRYGVIGLIVIFGSYAILNYILGIFPVVQEGGGESACIEECINNMTEHYGEMAAAAYDEGAFLNECATLGGHPTECAVCKQNFAVPRADYIAGKCKEAATPSGTTGECVFNIDSTTLVGNACPLVIRRAGSE